MSVLITDSFGRTLRYLRLSVTDRCNLGCTYCDPEDACAPRKPFELDWEDYRFLAQVAVERCGVEALRITGGEPTTRLGLVDWIASLEPLGLRDIALTTNGILLERMAEPLAEAGLTRINISLDTFDADRFQLLTRGGDLARVLAGIEAAKKLFRQVKINCVALRSCIENDLKQFVEFAIEQNITVRFIELMPIFDQKEYFNREFISTEELKRMVHSLGYELKATGEGHLSNHGYGPAQTYQLSGTEAHLGFISQMSDTKCLTCNKLRMTSEGALKPCLLMPEEIPLGDFIRDRNEVAIADALRRAFIDRAERYDAQTILEKPVARSMQATGG